MGQNANTRAVNPNGCGSDMADKVGSKAVLRKKLGRARQRRASSVPKPARRPWAMGWVGSGVVGRGKGGLAFECQEACWLTAV